MPLTLWKVGGLPTSEHIQTFTNLELHYYPTAFRMQQFLYFLPLPHGHGSLRPTFSLRLRIGSGFLSPFWLLLMAATFWPWTLCSATVAFGAASCTVAPIDHSDS